MSNTWREAAEHDEDAPQTAAPTLRDEGAEDTAAHSVLHLPTALAREWHIVSELANWGAEADLLVVENASGERRVAKIYRARIEPKTEVLQRVGGTSFEHVVQLYAHGTSDGRCYELLEYIETGSLEDLIRAEGPRLEVTQVSDVLWELTIAIEHLHEHRVVHRDIKPSNILVRTRTPLDLVLTDFGISSVLDQASRRFTAAAHRTIAYSAPETAAGEISPAADWWPLGIILVEMLTGRHPFAGAHAGTLLDDRVIMSRVAQVPVDDLVAGVDPPWRDLCRGLLRREAKNRWGSDEIRRWIRHDPTLTVTAEQGPSRYGLVPFFFAQRRYDSLPQIAAAFCANWQEARKSVERNHFFDWVKDELKDNEWRQFLSDLDRDCENLDERIFRICAKLDPSATPVFCGSPLDTQGLARLAREALAGTGDAESTVATLLRQRILCVAADVTGIAAYRELDDAWRREVRAFEERREALAAAAGPSALETVYAHANAALLLAVLPLDGTPYAETLRTHAADAVDDDVRAVDWFRALGDPRRASPAVALLMHATAPFAQRQGRAERQRRAAERLAAINRLVGQVIAGAAALAILIGVVWGMKNAVDHATPPGYQSSYNSGATVAQPITPAQPANGGTAQQGTTIDSANAVAFVNEYYRLWNQGDFRTMYGMLGSRMQAKNPYDQYVKYHSLVRRIDVDATATTNPAVVGVHIVSHDREKDGSVSENVNEGQWYLTTENGQLKLWGQDAHEVKSSSTTSAATNNATNATNATNAGSAVSWNESIGLVRQYYDLWNRGDYQAQYQMLSSRMQRKHPYEQFARYHANVVRIVDAVVTSSSSPLVVDVRVTTQDRETDGIVTQNVTEGKWYLAMENGRLKLDAQDVHEVK